MAELRALTEDRSDVEQAREELAAYKQTFSAMQAQLQQQKSGSEMKMPEYAQSMLNALVRSKAIIELICKDKDAPVQLQKRQRTQ